MADIYTPGSSVRDSRLPLDQTKCKASVRGPSAWDGYSQCSRPAGDDGWCKTHHPDAVATRRNAAEQRYEKQRRADAMGWYGESFMAALIVICDGDSNPRETARKALDGCPYAVGQ